MKAYILTCYSYLSLFSKPLLRFFGTALQH